MSTKQLSLRMPQEIYDQLSAKGKVARYVISAVQEKLIRDQQQAIEASLISLANDPEANDISDLAPSQAKVIARGD